MSSGGGSYTQEGNAAGSFAAKLEQQRDARHAEFERKKAAIEAETRKTLVSDDKFTTSSEQPQLAAKTVGLVTIDDFRKARENAEKQAAAGLREEIRAATAAAVVPAPAVPAAGAGGQPAAKRKRALLSFSTGSDDEDGDAGLEGSSLAARKPAAAGAGSSAGSTSSSSTAAVSSTDTAAAATTSSGAAAAKRPRFGKDPSVETGFLPDAEREAAAAALSEQLRGEWTVQQDRIKKEKIEVVYSWWDGTGHRRQIVVPKGATVGKFLEWVRQDLMAEFPALRGVSADSLLYVKEDLIMPHGVSFYDLIVNRVRGKSGPLFQFDVKHDVRLVLDSRVEKDESHPGKVVERRWYEKNKHQFPASRWELFDWASVKKYETAGYTTHGQEVHGKRA